MVIFLLEVVPDLPLLLGPTSSRSASVGGRNSPSSEGRSSPSSDGRSGTSELGEMDLRMEP
jgi:hypothetical protein